MFPAVVSPIFGAVIFSALALWLHNSGFSGVDATAHSVLGVLVSLLVVFRTQQAYARYWEGRGHLGSLMACVVDTASVASVELGNSTEGLAARAELARLLRLYFSETVRFLRMASFETRRVSNYWFAHANTNSTTHCFSLAA